MNRVFITGANGFIGRVLVHELKQKGCHTTALLRAPMSGDWDSSIQGDIRLGVDLLERKCDTFFHLAGKAHALSELVGDESEYHAVNTEGTRNMLELAKRMGARRFVYFSSIKAMGEVGEGQDESYTCEPRNPYGTSKLEAEKLVLEGGYVPHPVVIRPTMVYGPGAKGYLPQMIRFMQKGVFPPLSPKIKNKRSMVHVQDLVQAALLVVENLKASGQIYIVSDTRQYSTYDVYAAIRHALCKNIPRWSMPYGVLKGAALAGDAIGKIRGRRFLFDSNVLEKLMDSAWYNSRKIERDLGFRPKFDLYTAMPEIVKNL